MLKTKRLFILPCNIGILDAAIQGDTFLAAKLNCQVEENWTGFGIAPLQFVRQRLSENEDEHLWWTYFIIHEQDNRLIGCGGYKGKPDDNGAVEIGYEIAPSYRNRGLATEFSIALIENAFLNLGVNKIIAHTLGQPNASTNVLLKCGFLKTEEIEDPEEGPIWKWELNKKQTGQ